VKQTEITRVSAGEKRAPIYNIGLELAAPVQKSRLLAPKERNLRNKGAVATLPFDFPPLIEPNIIFPNGALVSACVFSHTHTTTAISGAFVMQMRGIKESRGEKTSERGKHGERVVLGSGSSEFQYTC